MSLPTPFSPGLEWWLVPRGRTRLPAPCSQLSLPVIGCSQARFHPQGLVFPSDLLSSRWGPPASAPSRQN